MKLLILLFCFALLPLKVSALELEAPPVPSEYRDWMPETTDSISDGLGELLRKAVSAVRPDLREAVKISTGILSAVLIASMIRTVSPSSKEICEMICIVLITVSLLTGTDSMITLAVLTVENMANYGKLLLPVMTAALAAQGGITASGAIYAGTAFFNVLLQSAMDSVLIPGIYICLTLRCMAAVTREEPLKRISVLMSQFISWCLKILMTVFTTYLSLTHVISGTTDAAVLKAAKVSMSTFVPVVGGVLSDASEAVLVSAGLMKNSAGLYGIFAVLSIFLHPFLRIGVHYLILKFTAAVCSIFAEGKVMEIIDCFSTALGLLLAMTAAGCIILLVSTFCFMKGVL